MGKKENLTMEEKAIKKCIDGQINNLKKDIERVLAQYPIIARVTIDYIENCSDRLFNSLLQKDF